MFVSRLHGGVHGCVRAWIDGAYTVLDRANAVAACMQAASTSIPNNSTGCVLDCMLQVCCDRVERPWRRRSAWRLPATPSSTPAGIPTAACSQAAADHERYTGQRSCSSSAHGECDGRTRLTPHNRHGALQDCRCLITHSLTRSARSLNSRVAAPPALTD